MFFNNVQSVNSGVNARMGFKADLARGEAAEKIIAAKLINLHGGEVTYSEGQKGWDFEHKIGSVVTSWECKFDARAVSSKNCFLEFSCSGKDSGLTSTTSDRWAVMIPDQSILLFCPKLMRAKLEEIGARTISGGDSKRAMGYLIKVEDVKKMEFVTEIKLTGDEI